MEQLNKCPFCGGEAEIIGRKKMKAVCKNCGASSPPFGFRSQAISYWNNRAEEGKPCSLKETKNYQ